MKPDSHGILLPEPLAYFLTWPTYGTWLPGDERGWVQYRRGWQLPDPVKKLEAAARMADDACRLDDEQRRVAESTISLHCQLRHWKLHGVNCRTNHVHVVVTAEEHPDKVRNQLKAWCTRRLKELEIGRMPAALCGQSKLRQHWWAERGSKRYINNLECLEAVIVYVRDAQDTPRYR